VSSEQEAGFLASLLRSETVGGGIALVAAGVAVLWASIDPGSYDALRHLDLGPLDLEHWAADGALALFFFVAGLELKRELLLGSLRRPADAAVPVAAAVCGVAAPALIFVLVNALSSSGGDYLAGWAIPAATDIAFALAVLAVVGSALPSSLRAFLLTLAVVDDLVVIVIIAIFYTDSIDLLPLLGSLGLLAAYAVCQRLRVRTPVVYLPLALGCWWLLHESGIHATIAGVALGLLTRVLPDPGETASPAERLEHLLSPVSAWIAVPFFALMSAGVELGSFSHLVRSPLVLGVVLGLVVGKPAGIMLGAWGAARLGGARSEDPLPWRDLLGVALLGGIGFTVSLLVSDLSFTGLPAEEAKTAVLIGSVSAAVLGGVLLRRRDRHHRAPGR
jgi:NhaA family Na+:H+ antiporter